ITSCGDLLWVYKVEDIKLGVLRFEVLKLDEEGEEWVELGGDELKERVIFLGHYYYYGNRSPSSSSFAFSVMAKDFPEYYANCIYVHVITSCGDLLWVYKVEDIKLGVLRFEVLKLDEEGEEWVELGGDELKERVIFLGHYYYYGNRSPSSSSFAFSVMAKDFPEYYANCIYVHGRKFTRYLRKGFDCFDYGIFELEDFRVRSWSDYYSDGPEPPTWLHKSLLSSQRDSLQRRNNKNKFC
ncbi:hypothetical protein Tsubulata_018995, partial [Turnera subulata]